MTDALTLIVLVAAGEGADATTRALTRATREALGPSAHVVVRESRSDPSDAEALAAERAEGFDAVAEVTWADAAHRDAILRVHIARGGRWLDRSIDFRDADADAERGRTLGFAIASTLPPQASAPEHPPTAGGAPAEAAGPTGIPTGPETTGTTGTTGPSGTTSAPTVRAPTRAGAPATGPAAPEPVESRGPSSSGGATHAPAVGRPRVAIDLLAIGAPSTAGGYGLTLTAQAFILPFLAVRAGGGFRDGMPPNGFDSSLAWILEGGIAAYALRSTRTRPIGVWAHVDVLAEDQGFTRQVGQVGQVSQASQASQTKEARHWTPVPAIDGIIDGSFLFLEDVEVVAGGGAELALASETVQRLGLAVVTLPRWRGVGEAGIRLRF